MLELTDHAPLPLREPVRSLVWIRGQLHRVPAAAIRDLLDLVAASQHGADEALERWQARFGPFDFALTRTDGGFDDNIQGRSRAKLTLEAPATSALPLLSGTSYEFVLGIGDNGSDPALEIPVTARVTGYGVKVKAGEKNSPSMIEYKAKVRGTFALGIGS